MEGAIPFTIEENSVVSEGNEEDLKRKVIQWKEWERHKRYRKKKDAIMHS